MFVRPYSTTHLFTLMKIVPEDHWDEYYFKCVYTQIKRDRVSEYDDYLNVIENSVAAHIPEGETFDDVETNSFEKANNGKDVSVNAEVSDREELTDEI